LLDGLVMVAELLRGIEQKLEARRADCAPRASRR
jgi:hypothetical protein